MTRRAGSSAARAIRGSIQGAAAALELQRVEDLAGALEGHVGASLRDVPGRSTFPWPDAEAPRAVIKRFEGDLARDRWYERLRLRGRGPAEREHDNLLGLTRDGLPVPAPLGWVAQGPRSALWMVFVPHDETLRDALARDRAAAGRWLEPLLRLVIQLHEARWYHRDLYLQHLVLAGGAGGEHLVLLDLGRARRETRPRRRWFEKDLAALLHSAPPEVGRSLALRFLVGYLDARGLAPRGPAGRQARRRWARRVERRRRRLAAHRPRWGEADPDPERAPDRSQS